MSKILIFSDIHIDAHKKSKERLQHCLDALEWVFKVATEKKVKDIVFAGDLFQNRQQIDVMTYNLTFDILYKYCKSQFNLFLLIGNHDLWFHDKWDISSVKPFSAIENVTVIDSPGAFTVGGKPIHFLPYTHTPVEYIKSLLATATYPKILVAHLAVDGAILNTLHKTHADVIIEHDGEMVKVDASMFAGWDQVWLGHYHGYQKIAPNVEYVGSTLQLSFGEAFQHKYVILYDLETGDKEYIKNTISPQHFIIPQEDIDKYDIENNFIRIEMKERKSSEVLELKNKVSNQKPGSLEIIQIKQEEEALVKDAKAILVDKDKMLETWVEQAETKEMDKKVLLDIGKELVSKINN